MFATFGTTLTRFCLAAIALLGASTLYACQAPATNKLVAAPPAQQQPAAATNPNNARIASVLGQGRAAIPTPEGMEERPVPWLGTVPALSEEKAYKLQGTGDIKFWALKKKDPVVVTTTTGTYQYGSHTICSGISGYSAPVKTVDYVAKDGQRQIIILNHPIQPNYPQYFYWKIPCSSNAYHGWYWYGLGPTIYQPYLDPGDVLAWFKKGLQNNNWAPAPPPSGYTFPKENSTTTETTETTSGGGVYQYGSHTICSGISGYSAPVKTVDYVKENGERQIIILNHPIQPNYPQYFYWKIPCSSNAYHGWYWYGLGPTIYQPYLDPNDVLTWFKNGLKNNNWAPAPPPAGYTFPKEGSVVIELAPGIGEGSFTSLAKNKVLYQVPEDKILLLNHYNGQVKINNYPVLRDEKNVTYTRPNFYHVFGSGEQVVFELGGGGVYGYTVSPEFITNMLDDTPLAFPGDNQIVGKASYEYGSHTICNGISGYSAPVKTVDYVAPGGEREIVILNHPIQPNYPQYFYWKIPCSSNAYHGWYWYGLGPTIYQPYLDPNDVLTWFKKGVESGNFAPHPPPAGYQIPGKNTVN